METHIDKILKGDVRAAAKLMRDIEEESPRAIEDLKALYPYTGNAYIIGVTGAPGVGKSTLVDTLVGGFREKEMTVGVVAIDPTSPFTGGAILGDRIRMQSHSTDPGVFIRSVATRGWAGGLSKATLNLIHIMDAMQKDIILVETVGTGQAEVDIINVADTSILVLIPGMGDAIQMMKAGILEGTDIFVINKIDRDSADDVRMQLEVMLETKDCPADGWKPPIVLTEAVNNKGITELVAEITRHRESLISSGGLEKRRKERARLELIEAVDGYLKSHITDRIDKDYLQRLVDDLAQKKTDPYSVALEIINRSVKLIG
jgi:LAO/AO transport system kinase